MKKLDCDISEDANPFNYVSPASVVRRDASDLKSTNLRL